MLRFSSTDDEGRKDDAEDRSCCEDGENISKRKEPQGSNVGEEKEPSEETSGYHKKLLPNKSLNQDIPAA